MVIFTVDSVTNSVGDGEDDDVMVSVLMIVRLQRNVFVCTYDLLSDVIWVEHIKKDFISCKGT